MSALPKIGAIVEGHGEIAALPILIRRIARELCGVEVICHQPHRLPKSKMFIEEEIARAVTLQTLKCGSNGLVVVLFDADDLDPEDARARVESLAENCPGNFEVLVAVREFEAWFLAALPSLLNHHDVRDDASYEVEPERRRNCKKEIELCMSASYSEMRHQPAFAALMDLEMAREKSPSFARFIEAVCSFLGSV